MTDTIHIVERGTIRLAQGGDVVVFQDFLTFGTCETIGMIETTRTNPTNEFVGLDEILTRKTTMNKFPRQSQLMNIDSLSLSVDHLLDEVIFTVQFAFAGVTLFVQ